MQLQLLACALATEESDEWDCAWCCVVNKERHHPHATSAAVADSTPASCRDASVLVGAKGNGGWRMRFGSDQAPCPDWAIPSPHGSRPRTPRPEGNWATSFFPVWSHSSITSHAASRQRGIRPQRCTTAKLQIDAIRNDCLKLVADKPPPLLRCPSLWTLSAACDGTSASVGVSRRQQDIAPSQRALNAEPRNLRHRTVAFAMLQCSIPNFEHAEHAPLHPDNQMLIISSAGPAPVRTCSPAAASPLHDANLHRPHHGKGSCRSVDGSWPRGSIMPGSSMRGRPGVSF